MAEEKHSVTSIKVILNFLFLTRPITCNIGINQDWNERRIVSVGHRHIHLNHSSTLDNVVEASNCYPHPTQFRNELFERKTTTTFQRSVKLASGRRCRRSELSHRLRNRRVHLLNFTACSEIKKQAPAVTLFRKRISFMASHFQQKVPETNPGNLQTMEYPKNQMTGQETRRLSSDRFIPRMVNKFSITETHTLPRVNDLIVRNGRGSRSYLNTDLETYLTESNRKLRRSSVNLRRFGHRVRNTIQNRKAEFHRKWYSWNSMGSMNSDVHTYSDYFPAYFTMTSPNVDFATAYIVTAIIGFLIYDILKEMQGKAVPKMEKESFKDIGKMSWVAKIFVP